jgi:energy-coupling factor transport system permease protein
MAWRRPRFAPLHPGAWWIWAGSLAVAAARTTDPVLLLLIIVVTAVVAVSRRSPSPWARSFGVLLRFGVLVVAIKILFQALFGLRLPGYVLFTLPSVHLPAYLAGVTLGGPVTIGAIVAAACQGLQLAAILACVGAATALVSPYRLLRCVPTALYEVAVAVTVALTFAPSLVASIGRVRAARRLRGRSTKGLRGLRGIAVPVLSEALERSVVLAASMDARGFGRVAEGLSPSRRRYASLFTLVGIVGIGIGIFGVLDNGAPVLLGLPVVGLGAVLTLAGVVARSHTGRTVYRPDRFATREWLTAASGLVALGSVLLAGHLSPSALQQQSYPLALPGLPLIGVLGIVAGLVPLLAAPDSLASDTMAVGNQPVAVEA